MYHVVHNTCIKHGRDIKTQYILGRHRSCDEERIEIISDSIESNHPSRNTSSLLYSKTGEVIYDKVYMSPRLPPKISLKHEWTQELGSKVARQPEGESSSTTRRGSCSTSKIFPTNPSNSKSNSCQIGAT